MMTYPPHAAAAPGGPHRMTWLRRSEAWLDDRGKWAWIAAMVLGFILFWPVGLALLAYMIWSKRMFSRHGCRNHRHHHGHSRHMGFGNAYRSSGNSAFDSYKAETLKRLEDEQQAFEAFLQRLRDAKDKSEFDSFMEDRAQSATRPASQPADDGAPRPGEY